MSRNNEEGARKFSADEISQALQDASQGLDVDEICKRLEIGVSTFYKWRQQFGCASPEQVVELQALEAEHKRLNKLLREQIQDNHILKQLVESIHSEQQSAR